MLFALLFVTGNTMMQSIRERVPELAVLKTYGFSNTAVNALVFAESALLCVTAAAVGLSVAAVLFPTMFDTMGVAPIPHRDEHAGRRHRGRDRARRRQLVACRRGARSA